MYVAAYPGSKDQILHLAKNMSNSMNVSPYKGSNASVQVVIEKLPASFIFKSIWMRNDQFELNTE